MRDVCAFAAGAARSPSNGCSAAISAAPSALAAAMALPGPSCKRRAGKTGKRGGGQHQARLLLLVLAALSWVSGRDWEPPMAIAALLCSARRAGSIIR
jgi:hypothetical protein